MLGLIGGALSGGAEAAQENAKTRIKTMRENALLKLKENMQLRAEERESERGAAATAAEWAREDQLTQEERAWQQEQDALERSHDTRIAGIRASSGGSSYKPPSRIQEADLLVARGVHDNFGDAYEAVRARAGQLDPREQAQDELEYYSGQLDNINEALNDRGLINRMPEDEVKALRTRREQIQGMIPDLESQAYGSGGLLGVPDPQPNPKPEPTPDPVSRNQGGNQGLRPGPSSAGTPTDRADAILNSILNQ